jgi:hypothetical protein
MVRPNLHFDVAVLGYTESALRIKGILILPGEFKSVLSVLTYRRRVVEEIESPCHFSNLGTTREPIPVFVSGSIIEYYKVAKDRRERYPRAARLWEHEVKIGINGGDCSEFHAKHT